MLSTKKISLVQTKVRFLVHHVSCGTITPTKRSLEFANKFLDRIINKTQLQRFPGSLNYALNLCPNINSFTNPLHNRFKLNSEPWIDEYTKIVQKIKTQVLDISYLHLSDSNLPKIVETDTSEIGYRGILKQVQGETELVAQYTYGHWFFYSKYVW